MKLTNYIRDAFIASAMKDVPTKDYSEQIRKIAFDDLVAQLPPAVAKVWADPVLRAYISTSWSVYGDVSITYPHPSRTSSVGVLSEEAANKLADLKTKNYHQQVVLKTLKEKLKSAAYGCTTRKQLAELLPEFEKYLPLGASKPSSAMLPAIANLVAEFSKAGWPKKNQAATT